MKYHKLFKVLNILREHKEHEILIIIIMLSYKLTS